MRRSLLFTLMNLFSLMAVAQPKLNAYNVIWNNPSPHSGGSMPIGNGDIGANVWQTPDGKLHLLLSKTDSHSEIGRLLKIGKVDIDFQPSFSQPDSFRQELVVEQGLIRIYLKKGMHSLSLTCRADANHPAIFVDGQSNRPLSVQVRQYNWRKQSRLLTGIERHSGYGVTFRNEPFPSETDTVLTVKDNLAWCHENKSSIWQMTLDNQNISDFAEHSSDPLLNQRFGALVSGDKFITKQLQLLETAGAQRNFQLQVTVHKSKTDDAAQWLSHIQERSKAIQSQPGKGLLLEHTKWWKNFWNRHYLIVESERNPDTTFRITQAYLLQRYMNACAGRGALPIKFNGSIFTTDLNEPIGNGKKGFDADYRDWGGNYWFQNTRLMYWTMYHSGDADLMKPFFEMYLKALPLATFRTQKYFGHGGAYFTETLTPWGSYLIDNYGWDRKGKKDGVSDNMYIRYYWQGGLELSTMMTEYLRFFGDTTYFNNHLYPFIKEIFTFYKEHYPRDKQGKLYIYPAQSLETFQEGISNPTPEIAGLQQNLRTLINLKNLLRDTGFLPTCRQLLKELPELPIGDSAGKKYILAGSDLGPKSNIENPELYTIFPYKLFGMGKPNLKLAQHTYDLRSFKNNNGWTQDALQAALIGRAEEARQMVTNRFLTKHRGSRFPVFWGPNYDWVPDQDHGSVAMIALQYMLLQYQEDELLLLPAWPADWNASFKMHTPGNDRIEGRYDAKKGLTLTHKPKGLRITYPVK
jgi:hypothetical protein